MVRQRNERVGDLRDATWALKVDLLWVVYVQAGAGQCMVPSGARDTPYWIPEMVTEPGLELYSQVRLALSVEDMDWRISRED